jgi:hypothetical protein
MIEQFPAGQLAPGDGPGELAGGRGGEIKVHDRTVPPASGPGPGGAGRWPVPAFEHSTTSVYGEPRQYTLRATHVWRREDGEWKIVHRHGDVPPADNFSSPDH